MSFKFKTTNNPDLIFINPYYKLVNKNNQQVSFSLYRHLKTDLVKILAKSL
jgi:hypothetical protein